MVSWRVWDLTGPQTGFIGRFDVPTLLTGWFHWLLVQTGWVLKLWSTYNT